MIIKIEDSKYEKFDLPELIKNEGIEVETVKKSVWDIRHNNKTYKLIKGVELFSHFDLRHSKTSIQPHFTLIDIEDKKITLIIKRTQQISGSTDQKLPYGEFLIADYLKQYEFEDYDLEIAFSLNSFFKDQKYGELKKYLKQKSIKLWQNSVKI